MDGPFDFYNPDLGKPYFYNKGTGEPFIPKVLFPDPRSWPQITARCAKLVKPPVGTEMIGITFRAHQSATPILLCAGSFN